MAADDRRHRLAAADEEGSGARAVTGRTGTLLAVPLLGRAVDLAAGLGLVRTGAALGELPDDDALDEVSARLQTEDLVLEIDLARRLGIQVEDLQLHLSPPPSLRI